MGVPAFTKKWLNQDLVYWEFKSNDGEGGFEFEDPVPLKGRYEKKTEQVMTSGGEEKVSRARVFVDQELLEGSYIYVGTLQDDAIGLDQSPEKTLGSMRVLASDVIPSWNGRTSLYIAYANMGSYNR